MTFDLLEDRSVPATYQWIGGGPDSNWNTAANWTLISGTGTFPNAVGDVAQFTGAYSAEQDPVITANVTVGEIDFGGAGYTGNFGIKINRTAGTLTLKNTTGPAVLNVNSSANTTLQTITFTTNAAANGFVATSGGLIVNQSASLLNLTITEPIKTGNFGEYATVNAGTLLQNDNATTTSLGPTSTFTVNNGGTLSVGATATFAVGQNNLGTGTITLNAGSTLKVNNANDPVALANNIVFGSNASVTLAGAPFLFLGGTITLNGNNTLKVNTGTLTTTLSPVLTTIADTLVGTGTETNKLTIGTAAAGTGSRLGDVTFAGSSPIVLAGKALTLASGSSYPGGASSTPTFTVNTPTTITNVLGGTVSALTIAGASTLTLTGNNTYTGLTNVVGGTLVVAGSLASSGVSVASGATLAGSGSLGNLALGSGNLALVLSDATTYDAFAVAGSLNLSGATLNLSVGTVNDGDTFTIFSVAGTDPAAVTGTFVNLPTSGSSLTIGNRIFTINYAGGDGNDIVLTALPSAPPADREQRRPQRRRLLRQQHARQPAALDRRERRLLVQRGGVAQCLELHAERLPGNAELGCSGRARQAPTNRTPSGP